MNENTINEWVGQAKAHENENVGASSTGVQVIRKHTPKSRGVLIMEVAEKLRPFLTQWLDGKYNDDGMLVQQAHIRGIAVNVAEGLVKKHYQNDNVASA